MDPTQIVKPRDSQIAIMTSARQGMQALLDELGTGEPPERDAFLGSCRTAAAKYEEALGKLGNLPGLNQALRDAMPRDAFLVTDVTQLGYYARYGFPVYEPRTLLGPSYLALKLVPLLFLFCGLPLIWTFLRRHYGTAAATLGVLRSEHPRPGL